MLIGLKNMNCIFISPNYPAGHWRYAAALRSAGYSVLCIGDAGDETFSYELRGNITEYLRVGDLHDYDAVYRCCGYFISKYGRIDRIESLNPYWEDLVEALRGEFTRSLPSPEQIYPELAKKRLSRSLLPEAVLSASTRKAASFAAQNGYPISAVPAENKKAGCKIITCAEELKNLGREKYLLSRVPAGDTVSLDGLTRNGAAVFCAAHLMLENGGLISLPVPEQLREKCSALAGRDGFFHMDAVRLSAAVPGLGKKGDIVPITFSETPPHEYIVDCINAEYGCDLRALWVDPEAQCEPSEPVCCAACVCRSFERSYKNPHERILHRLGAKLTRHGLTAEPDKESFFDYVYIFTGDSPAELRRGIKYITEDFKTCQ